MQPVRDMNMSNDKCDGIVGMEDVINGVVYA